MGNFIIWGKSKVKLLMKFLNLRTSELLIYQSCQTLCYTEFQREVSLQEEGKVRWLFDGKLISGINLGHLLLLLEIKLSERLSSRCIFLMEIHIFFNLKSCASEILFSLMITEGNQFSITHFEIDPINCLSPWLQYTSDSSPSCASVSLFREQRVFSLSPY